MREQDRRGEKDDKAYVLCEMSPNGGASVRVGSFAALQDAITASRDPRKVYGVFHDGKKVWPPEG